MTKTKTHISELIFDDIKKRREIYAGLLRFFDESCEIGCLAFSYFYLKSKNMCQLSLAQERVIAQQLHTFERPTSIDMRYCAARDMFKNTFTGFTFEQVVIFASQACRELYKMYFNINHTSLMKELLCIQQINMSQLDIEAQTSVIALLDAGKTVPELAIYGFSESEVVAIVFDYYTNLSK